MANIFISYASEDKEIVEEIFTSLTQKGHTVWMDKKNLVPGQNWKIEIEKAINFSDIFLACLSNNSVDKQGYVQKELKTALDFADQKPESTIYIVPIRLDNCEVPFSLKELQWANYFEPNGMELILNAINHAISVENSKTPEGNTLPQKQVSTGSEYSSSIKQNIESIVYNSALLCEYMGLQITTWKTHAQLQEIDDRLGHVDYNDPFNNAEFARRRIAEFNKVTDLEFTEHNLELVDFFLSRPEQLPVWYVFEEIYKDSFQKEWGIYKSYFEGKTHLVFDKDNEDVYKQINEWMRNKAIRIYKVVRKNFPDVSPKMYSSTPLEF